MFILNLPYNTVLEYGKQADCPLVLLPTFSALTIELIVNILQNIKNPRDIAALMFVNRAFFQTHGHPRLWRNIARVHTPNYFFKNRSFKNTPWFKAVKDSYRGFAQYDIFPLMAALTSGELTQNEYEKPENVELIMDVMFPTIEGQNTLHFAGFFYQIAANPNQNIRDYFFRKLMKKEPENGHTVLQYAAAFNQVIFIQELANINSPLLSQIDIANHQNTPLQFAAYFGHAEMVRLLLRLGANRKHNPVGAKPLVIAAQHGHIDVVRSLLAENPTQTNNAALVEAVKNGHYNIVCALMPHANVHIKTGINSSDTLLHIAAGAGHYKIFKLLFDANIDFQSKNASGYTPLSLAVQGGHLKIVDHFIPYRKLFDKNMLSSLLFITAKNNDVRMLALLLELGADVNSPTFDKRETPLTIAIYHKYFSFAQAMIDAGANFVCSEVLEHASASGYHALVRKILESGAFFQQDRVSSMLYRVILNEDVEMLKLLIQLDADINCSPSLNPYRTNNTPLSFALKKMNVNIVNILIEAGAYFHAISHKYINNRLVAAACQNNLAFVKLILEKKNHDIPKIALKRAISEALCHANLEMTLTLIRAGAEIDIPNLARDVRLNKASAGIDEKFLARIKLEEYIVRTKARGENHYKHSLTISFFCFKKTFHFGGYSSTQKLAAAKSLKKVVKGKSGEAFLNKHRGALNNGELKTIYRSLMRRR